MSITCTPQALATAARCFDCIPNAQSVKTRLMAVVAGGSRDPQVLATASSCYLCLAGQYEAVRASLLCRLLNLQPPQTCDPQALANQAVGFINLPNYVELYLWAVRAGGSLDPRVLEAQAAAACFNCLKEMAVAVQIKLLCDMLGTGPCDVNTLSKNASCFRCLPDPRSVSMMLLCRWNNTIGCTPPTVSSLALTNQTDKCFEFQWASTRNPNLYFLVYYGTASHVYNGPESPKQVNSANRASTLCTTFGNGSILPLTNYFVVVTAVDSVGCESAASNEIVGSTV